MTAQIPWGPRWRAMPLRGAWPWRGPGRPAARALRARFYAEVEYDYYFRSEGQGMTIDISSIDVLKPGAERPQHHSFRRAACAFHPAACLEPCAERQRSDSLLRARFPGVNFI